MAFCCPLIYEYMYGHKNTTLCTRVAAGKEVNQRQKVKQKTVYQRPPALYLSV
jgi:hypothetical protein